MSKPDDIPQDVWDAAEGLAEKCSKYFHDVYWHGESSIDPETEIARAILAERERCAGIAETLVPTGRYKSQKVAHGASLHIAMTIRGRKLND